MSKNSVIPVNMMINSRAKQIKKMIATPSRLKN